MTDRTITLRSDLVEQLEALASHVGKTLNEVVEQFPQSLYTDQG